MAAASAPHSLSGKDWRHIGCTLIASAKYATAVAAFLRARALGEEEAEFHRELAVALWHNDERDGAMREIFEATRKDPKNFAVAACVSNFLLALGEPAGAAKWLTHAIEIEPDAQARFNRSLALLAAGSWSDGFSEYDSRFDLFPSDFPSQPMPLWTGHENLHGKTIWVPSEQGAGDQIQFSRYVPWLASKGARVVYDSRPELARFSPAEITRAVGHAGKFAPPAADFYCPLLSLPARHGTTLDNVPPAPRWYKEATRSRLALAGAEGKKKIGLIWAGSKEHPGDHLRSMPFQYLLPLMTDIECEFYSFQCGEENKQITEAGAEPFIRRPLSLNCWEQTASALLALDALVTVDTGCAHLAGSLGVKTFLMLSTEPDWRWCSQGAKTPWYPSMMLVRQERRGDWGSVVRKVAGEVKALKG